MPLAAWVVVLLWGALLVLYAIAVPQYRGADEPAHVDLVVHLVAGEPYPPSSGLHFGAGVLQSTVPAGYGPAPGFDNRTNAPLTKAPPQPRGARPSFTALGGTARTAAPNQMGQHPPLYYEGMAYATRLLGDPLEDAFDRTVLAMRLLSALLVLPLPLLAFVLARRLFGRPPVSLAAAAAVLTVPRLTGAGASVTNDTLLLLLTTAALVLAGYVVTGDRTIRTALLLGVLGGLALLTKGLALYVPLWTALVYLAAAARQRDPWLLARGALSVAVMTAAGAWWYLRNYLQTGSVQPAGAAMRPHQGPTHPITVAGEGAHYLSVFIRRLVKTFWVNVSIPSTDRSAGFAVPWSWVLTALALVAVVAGLARARGRAGVAGTAVVCAVPFLVLGAQLLAVTWLNYRRFAIYTGLQGRYLYPGVVGVLVAAAAGAAVLARRRAALVPLVVLVLAAVVQLRALLGVLEWHWGLGRGRTLSGALSGIAAWAPWPAPATTTALLAPALLGLAALGLALRGCGRRTPPLQGAPVPAR